MPYNKESSPVPEWHVKEVTERMDRYYQNPKKQALDFYEAMDEIETEFEDITQIN